MKAGVESIFSRSSRIARANVTRPYQRVLATLFANCRITSAKITTHFGVAQFPSIRTMVEADLRGWLPVMGVFLTEKQIDHILFEADQALSDYTTADGRVRFQLSAHIVTVKKPK